MEFEQLTEKIIGCAYTVYKKLRYGFLESVYEKALLIELKKAGLAAETQFPINVEYDGEVIGSYFCDVLVEQKVILELKSVSKIIVAHEVQLVNYLTATEKPVGLIINFAEHSVEVRRKVRKLPPSTDPENPVHPV